MAANIFASLFRRAPQVAESTYKFPYTVVTNPYRCKRTWPPDFSQLSHKHQFSLERRYRRRSQLKWERPKWKKGVLLVQWASIVFVVFYGVLVLEVENGKTPFDEIREYFRQQFGTLSGDKEKHSVENNSPAAPKQPS